MSLFCRGRLMTRTQRLYAMIDLLRRRRTGVRVADLADRFEVSARTILRDLDALRAQGLPILTETGPGGGVRLGQGHTLGPLGLSVEEALQLWLASSLGGVLSRRAPSGPLKSAQEKLLLALPQPARDAVLSAISRVIIADEAQEGLSAQAPAADPQIITCCEDALLRCHRLRIEYRDGVGRVSLRHVEPHGMLMRWPAWYLLTLDVEKQAPRAFRLDRVISAERLAHEPFIAQDPRPWFPDAVALERLDLR